MMAAAHETVNEVHPELFEFKENVIVTGFGPFQGHPTNASWEAVKLLPKLNIDKELCINLITEQIPVDYNVVEKKIPQLWEKYKPLLVIHVGVSKLSRNLTLERCANQNGYTRCDINGQTPIYGTCRIGNNEKIYSTLDFLKISGKINSMNDCIETSVSTDAGRYLCEFIYYTSLSQDNSRCIFIHVPELEKPYSAETTANGLYKIIKLLVEELRFNRKQDVEINKNF